MPGLKTTRFTALCGITEDARQYARENPPVKIADLQLSGGTLGGSNAVVVTSGATEALGDCLFGLIEPGDEVVYPNPSFPIYESIINFLGAKPVPIPLIESHFVGW